MYAWSLWVIMFFNNLFSYFFHPTFPMFAALQNLSPVHMHMLHYRHSRPWIEIDNCSSFHSLKVLYMVAFSDRALTYFEIFGFCEFTCFVIIFFYATWSFSWGIFLLTFFSVLFQLWKRKERKISTFPLLSVLRETHVLFLKLLLLQQLQEVFSKWSKRRCSFQEKYS